MKCSGCFFQPVPISLRHAGTADPDFSNMFFPAFLKCLRIDNPKLLAGDCCTASCKNPRWFIA